METTIKTYKGVNLINNRTESMINYIIENYQKESLKIMVKKLGLKHHYEITPIIRVLLDQRHIAKAPYFLRKKYKGVELTDIITKEKIDGIIKDYKYFTASELAEKYALGSYQTVNWIKRYLLKTKNIDNKNIVIKPKEAKKTCLNTFDNYDGDGKLIARNMITDRITSTSPKDSNILTLPADKWLMEKQILAKRGGYKFTAVEQYKETFEDMLKNMVADDNLINSVISTHRGQLSDVIYSSKENTFSNAILDYCGVIDTVLPEFTDLLERNLVKKGGYITLTTAQVNRTKNNNLYANNFTNKFIEICAMGENIKSVDITNFLVNYTLFSFKGRYKLDETFMYKDNIKGYGMILYIIKRMF